MAYEPEPPTEPREGKPVLHCSNTEGCQEAIYEYDAYYDIDDLILCEDCGRTYLDYLYKRVARRPGA